MPAMAYRYAPNWETAQSLVLSDSLKSYPPQAPVHDIVAPEAPSGVIFPTPPDSLVAYPTVVNPNDIPSNTVQDTETREAGKHIPPGGEEQLEQLKSKELPVTNDSTVIRVKPVDKY